MTLCARGMPSTATRSTSQPRAGALSAALPEAGVEAHRVVDGAEAVDVVLTPHASFDLLLLEKVFLQAER
eukprot:9638987-Prorocentrum_lima.AAC.1